MEDSEYDWTALDWKSPKGQLLVRFTAVHEAGHAVARWYLERTQYLGRRYVCPYVEHVTISREGEPVVGSCGTINADRAGLVAADPFCFPMGGIQFADDIPTAERRRFAKLFHTSAMADIIFTMAGPIAEQIHKAALDRRLYDEPCTDADDWLATESDDDFAAGIEEGTDCWQVEQRIPMLGRRWRLHLERCFTTADHIVRQHQAHIHALADALVERGTVEGDEAWRLFDEIGAPIRPD